MKKITKLFYGSLFLLLAQNIAAQNIVINEILTSNTATNKDEDDSYQDWVELYNNGPAAVNLSGYGLSDDPSVPLKWVFPNVTVASGQYLLVWCSDKNRAVPGNPLHTNFKISSSGETITLCNALGVAVDTAPPVDLQPDVSYGRLPNGTGPFVFFADVTPAAVNSTTGYSGTLNAPTVSQNSGFFTSAFDITLAANDPGATILYTLDGSEPDPNNLGGTTYQYKNQYQQHPSDVPGPLINQTFTTLSYSGPIAITDRSSQPNKVAAISSTYHFDPNFYLPDSPVFKGTIVRAKVVKPGLLPSKTVSRTYFVSPAGNNEFTIPVISLSFDENKFFDYNEGIYVAGVDFDTWRAAHPTLTPGSREVGNYYRNGIENEKQANMTYFVNGVEVLNQDVGLRIRGASTRRYESKSLTVYARSDYGDESLSYKFFPDLADESFARLTLSMSGSDFRNTMFRDALDHDICKELHVENENYQPTVTFLNGEFWGILNIRERYDDEYFDRVYGTDDVDLLENEGRADQDEVEEGDDAHYQAMMTYLQNNSLAGQANYNYIKTQLDPESFSDFQIANIFLQNYDWPGNNVQYWRKKTAAYQPDAPYGHDGRWRWMFHDMDDTFSFGVDDFNGNTLAIATSVDNNGVNPEWSTRILRRLLENASYKNDFINRFADLLNTSFLSTRIVARLDAMASAIAPEMPKHIQRWRSPANIGDWEDFLQYERDFANARPALQRNHIRSQFGIAANINATLDVSDAAHGHVKINTIDITDGTPGISGNPYPWTGIYFSDIPVKAKAIANPGFIFSHWEGASTSTDAEITVTSAASFSLKAIFIPEGFATAESEPIYFWWMSGAIPNDTPLLALNSSYELTTDATINFTSAFEGYPFTPAHPNWRKASMERRNKPTPINYRPEANNNAPYVAGDMKALQITQPFQDNGRENTMVFGISTLNYKSIKFSFAAMDEGAATGISIDYSVNAGAPVWITSGLAATSLPLATNTFQLYESDFTDIASANNNVDFKIRLRFTGPDMTASAGNRVTFNNIAVDGARLALTYPTPNVFTVGTTITSLVPELAAAATSFTITPALPAGLNFDTATGIISGTPTAISPTTSYTVTATNAGGSVTFPVTITVNGLAPAGLSYNTPNVYTVGTAITALVPSVTGDVASYAISGLPAGLSFDTVTGIISGTPTVVAPMATYTVLATNASGSVWFDIVIAVNAVAPTDLSYLSPNVYTVGNAITALTPTVTGNVDFYNVIPVLPTGLTFDVITGTISGTPTAVSPLTTYLVTATNSGGSVSFPVVITINTDAPVNLSYNSPNVYTVGMSISGLSPSVTGNIESYSVFPALPDGLVLDAVTGIISGTPTNVSSLTTYLITASNSGGSVSFALVITVNDAAPASLSYDTPNVYTIGTSINLIPFVLGNVTNWTITGDLPIGVTFDPVTGIISGVPTTPGPIVYYTVTASNSGGSVSFELTITVVDVAPAALSYPSPNLFHTGETIANLIPTVNGNVTTYTIAPALPDGLSMDAATGIISGTPTTVTATAAYTVTASNSGGNVSFEVIITVDEELSVDGNTSDAFVVYPNPFTENVYLKGASAAIEYMLFSVEGKLIRQGKPNASVIALPDLPTGIYLLRLSWQGKTKTVKMIKQ